MKTLNLTTKTTRLNTYIWIVTKNFLNILNLSTTTSELNCQHYMNFVFDNEYNENICVYDTLDFMNAYGNILLLWFSKK